jgi:hypothetical protein
VTRRSVFWPEAAYRSNLPDVANPYAPPAGSSRGTSSPIGQGRGGCLTAFLILMMIANSVAVMVYLFLGDLIRRQPPHPPAAAIPLLGVACAANVVFAIATWRWKKWGVYGFVGMSVVAFIGNVLMGTALLNTLFGLLGPVILWLLIRQRWADFR